MYQLDHILKTETEAREAGFHNFANALLNMAAVYQGRDDGAATAAVTWYEQTSKPGVLVTHTAHHQVVKNRAL